MYLPWFDFYKEWKSVRLEHLTSIVDNIFVVFAGKVFQQIIGIPMGTNCAPVLADIFLYSYEAEFIQSLLSTGRKRLASQFNFTYRYIDDILYINNPDFENYLGQMYQHGSKMYQNRCIETVGISVQLHILSKRIKNISKQMYWNGWHLSSTSHIDTSMTYCTLITLTLRIITVRCITLNFRSKTRRRATLSASYLDLLLSIGRDTLLHTSLYDNRDDFNFHITNFPFLNSNISFSPAYGVFISQFIPYVRASSSYQCFILRVVRLSNKLKLI